MNFDPILGLFRVTYFQFVDDRKNLCLISESPYLEFFLCLNLCVKRFLVELGAEHFTGTLSRRLHTATVELDHFEGSLGGHPGPFENGAEGAFPRENG